MVVEKQKIRVLHLEPDREMSSLVKEHFGNDFVFNNLHPVAANEHFERINPHAVVFEPHYYFKPLTKLIDEVLKDVVSRPVGKSMQERIGDKTREDAMWRKKQNPEIFKKIKANGVPLFVFTTFSKTDVAEELGVNQQEVIDLNEALAHVSDVLKCRTKLSLLKKNAVRCKIIYLKKPCREFETDLKKMAKLLKFLASPSS